MMWLFGKSGRRYRLVSFRVTFGDGAVIMDESTYRSYSYGAGDDGLGHLNDFVGSFTDPDMARLRFVVCSSEGTLLSNRERDSSRSA